LGGVVSLTPVRDRTGEGNEAFAISWHSNGGDICWISPKITSEEAADVAATVLSQFIGGVRR
jgi:hypothetical protein